MVSGRALALSTTTKSGGKFVIINLYQFTAANPVEQHEVWDIIAAWVLKHPNDKIILIGDLNSAPAGERTGYSLPLGNSLRQADADCRTSAKTREATSLTPDTTHGVGEAKRLS